MSDTFVAPPEFHSLKREAESRGFTYGLDFFVWGIPSMISSEVIVFGVESGEYTVTYRDLGEDHPLARDSDFAVASTAFLEEIARLAGPRGRGPYANEPERSRYDGLSRKEAFELMQAEGKFPGVTWEEVFGSEDPS